MEGALCGGIILEKEASDKRGGRFFENYFSAPKKLAASSEKTVFRKAFRKWARDRSLPRPVGEAGRRSVGNRKERLRDYASSPGDTGDNYDSDTLRKSFCMDSNRLRAALGLRGVGGNAFSPCRP